MRPRGTASRGLVLLVSIFFMSLPHAVRTVSLGLCLDALLAQHLQLLHRHSVDQPILLGHRLGCNGLERARHVEGTGEQSPERRRDALFINNGAGGATYLSLSSLRGAAPPGVCALRPPPTGHIPHPHVHMAQLHHPAQSNLVVYCIENASNAPAPPAYPSPNSQYSHLY